MDFDEKTQRFTIKGEPAARADGRSACFIVIAGSQAGRLYKLERDGLVIGRAPDASVRIDDDGVSRYHARICLGPDNTVLIEDMGSTNGTFCNGERVGRHTMQDGDKIQIGRTSILKFSFQDSIEEDFQRRQYESATRDALTDCFNKKYLLERLPAEFAFAQRHKKFLSLAMVDIDHFKHVNDTHGHPAGDHILREVAQVLQKESRRGDVLARYGGEEFAMIMREIAVGDAYVVAERIRRRVETTRFVFKDVHIPLTVSIGVSVLNDNVPGTAEELLQIADSYLYRAKSNGRNRTECELFG